MVANFTAKVVKAYVHVPGTGSAKKAGVSFCDLSHGSDLAASIPVPQHVEEQRNVSIHMPRYVEMQRDSSNPVHQHVEMQRNGSSPVSVHVEMQRTLIKRQRDEDKTNKRCKKLRLESTNAENNDVKIILEEHNQLRFENANLKRQVALGKGLFRNPQTLRSLLQRGNISSAINEMMRVRLNHNMDIFDAQSEHELSKLEKENTRLKSENTSLQKQVDLFMELFRNPQRVSSVLQRLTGNEPARPVTAA